MEDDLIEKMMSTTLLSNRLTHLRLKHLAGLAETSEDHISRIGLGLSLRMGLVSDEWEPCDLGADDAPFLEVGGKNIRGKTLFKSDLTLFTVLVLQHQVPTDYNHWRTIMTNHWERGVQLLTQRAAGKTDWLDIVTSLPIG